MFQEHHIRVVQMKVKQLSFEEPTVYSIPKGIITGYPHVKAFNKTKHTLMKENNIGIFREWRELNYDAKPHNDKTTYNLT